ncbi:MAG TPA: FtsQ-type POTRA domain-containing protein [Acidobacteriota bacterium]|nr:FtsQ-type POTRA domain-containing protein [Acidobacteriota bacterium]HNT17338.1 FtsQ-type POTRA domain-containing protein [Acidobacteriota bacterium]HPA27250.1 FtsQ-type POTRA domain-containing protein [Acidobacteriota bacterium]HQO19205.1 FtsQ-type POTRA domain-containing protein [Acidobacteriota bacterium]HQQ47127.1 FtsQ-type POTRA domain-containing protein [Acidobacteriota bacterium]
MIEARDLYRSEEAVKLLLPLKKPQVVKRRGNLLRLALLLAVAAAVMVPACFAAGGKASSIRESLLFPIRTINVRGVDGVNSQTVKDALSSLSGRSLWALSASDVEEAVSKFGFAEGFLMKKQYPSEVTIEIRQRASSGAVRFGSRFYQFDGLGNYWELESHPGEVPELNGNFILSDIKLQELVGEIHKCGLYKIISTIAPQQPDSFLLRTREGRELVVFAEDFMGQWTKYQSTEGWIRRNIGAGGRIDLRWSNRVVIVPSAAPQEEVEENGKA